MRPKILVDYLFEKIKEKESYKVLVFDLAVTN